MLYHDNFYLIHLFFFFQAEDGIRDVAVTGVQTCALPIVDRRVHSAALPALGPLGEHDLAVPDRVHAPRALPLAAPGDDPPAPPHAGRDAGAPVRTLSRRVLLRGIVGAAVHRGPRAVVDLDGDAG